MMELLRAPNGDVLRGRLESLQGESAGFKSGLERLIVPREKIAEVVRLEDMLERSEDEGTLTAYFFGGGSLTLRPGVSDEQALRGAAQATAAAGRFTWHIPRHGSHGQHTL